MTLNLFKSNWQEVLDAYALIECEYTSCKRCCYPTDVPNEKLCKLHQDWGLTT